MDGSLRQFFENLKSYVEEMSKENPKSYEFTQREVRLKFRISRTQMQRFFGTLLQMEYLQQRGFANRGYRYKISYWDDSVALRQRIKSELQEQVKVIA